MGILEERTKNLIKELHNNPFEKWESGEIQKIVNDILRIECIDTQAVPIVKIASHYDIKVYKEKMKPGIEASIFLNGNTIDIYGTEKVIVVNKDEELCWKRYFIAIELGKYILDFLCNDSYQNNDFYSHQYGCKNHNDSIELKRFATEILMPEDSFVRQYRIAMKENNNRLFTLIYLSRFFNVPLSLIEVRINEIINS